MIYTFIGTTDGTEKITLSIDLNHVIGIVIGELSEDEHQVNIMREGGDNNFMLVEPPTARKYHVDWLNFKTYGDIED